MGAAGQTAAGATMSIRKRVGAGAGSANRTAPVNSRQRKQQRVRIVFARIGLSLL
jgi:hypothetical protein